MMEVGTMLCRVTGALVASTQILGTESTYCERHENVEHDVQSGMSQPLQDETDDLEIRASREYDDLCVVLQAGRAHIHDCQDCPRLDHQQDDTPVGLVSAGPERKVSVYQSIKVSGEFTNEVSVDVRHKAYSRTYASRETMRMVHRALLITAMITPGTGRILDSALYETASTAEVKPTAGRRCRTCQRVSCPEDVMGPTEACEQGEDR